jgi:Tfp pilus assembly protein PilN
MLCKTLSEKRTKRALVLETLASTRPQELTLEQIRIGERRKRLEKDAGTTESEDAVFLKGYSDNGDRITEWMDLLVKSKAFSGVTMVSLEKKAGAYHFQIECTIEH